jgi:hypothetical protein
MSNLDLKTYALNVSRPTTLEIPANSQVLTPIWRPNGTLGLVVLCDSGADPAACEERTFLAVLKARAEAPGALDSADNLRYVGEGGKCLVFEVGRSSLAPESHDPLALTRRPRPAPPANPAKPKRRGRPRKNPEQEDQR